MPQGPRLRLVGLTKEFAPGRTAVRNVNLDVEPGEWLVLAGPSGCGKTTTLRLIAGLEAPTHGTVFGDGSDWKDSPPWKRGVALVAQKPALIPHWTVRRHLEDAAGAEFSRWLEPFRLADLMERKPGQLSGGEQQRVALAYAFAQQKPVILLDEPLGHLDGPLRGEIRRQMLLLHQTMRATIISVTHDSDEAWALGNRVAVLHQGVVLQVDRPHNMSIRPAHRFVAEFFQGDGPMNLLPGELRREEGSSWFQREPWRVRLTTVLDPTMQAVLGIRARDIRVGAGVHTLAVVLVEPSPQGAWVTGDVHGWFVTAWAEKDDSVAAGQKVLVDWDWRRAYLFDTVTGRTLGMASE